MHKNNSQSTPPLRLTPQEVKATKQTFLEILPRINYTDVENYNYSKEGILSWYDFAKAIMRMAKLHCKINPIETKEYPTPAKRPHSKDGLDDYLRRVGERR
jgi:dTDP-4-dehydrorhamnose reductase